MNKWSEEKLTTYLSNIAMLCAAGLLSWDQKEAALEDSLKIAGWSREELRELNRRREAENN